MKKLLIFLFTFLAIVFISIYYLIPDNLDISEISYVNCNLNGAFRMISEQNDWERWWPKTNSEESDFVENRFFYNGFTYHLSQKFYNAVEISVSNQDISMESRINIIEINVDSVVLLWKGTLFTTRNPITKISRYRQAEDIKNDMRALLSQLKSFLNKKENIYGHDMFITMSKDSTMVAIKDQTTGYPSVANIYDLISNLKKYIADENATENNFPMLHIKKLGDSLFETMVAIPVNKQLPGKGPIFFSRFVPWKVLTAEVKGGTHTVDEALREMKVYMSDYHLSAMAIPFQSLITNRSEEPDTSKWITRIYTPVP
jgi:hypothetical protein